MAVAFDAVGVGSGAINASISWTHTVSSNTNGIVIVAVALSNTDAGSAIGNVNYGATLMTQITELTEGTGATARRIALYYLLSPSTGATTVTVANIGSAATVYGNSMSFTGVSQSAPIGTPATNGGTSVTSVSTTITCGSTDIIVAALSARTSSTVSLGGSQNSNWNTKTNTTVAAVGSYQSGGSGITSSFSWTGADNGGMIAVALLDASGGGGGTIVVPSHMMMGMGQ